MATTVTKTVGPGKDYTTLAAFEAGEQRNLVSADEIAQALCSNFEDTTAVFVSGWTTDATRYVEVVAEDAHLSRGAITTNAYRMNTGANTSIIQAVTKCVLRGLQLQGNRNGALISAISSDLEVDSCILYNAHVSGDGITAETVSRIWNTIIRVVNNAFEGTLGTDHRLYSVTATGSMRWKVGAQTKIAKNCYASTYVNSPTLTTCASADTTGNIQNVPLDNTVFEDVAVPNYTPVSGGALDTSGTDTSGDAAPFDFTDDILGVARTTPWSVGAIEGVTIRPGRIQSDDIDCKVVDTETLTCKVTDNADV